MIVSDTSISRIVKPLCPRLSINIALPTPSILPRPCLYTEQPDRLSATLSALSHRPLHAPDVGDEVAAVAYAVLVADGDQVAHVLVLPAEDDLPAGLVLGYEEGHASGVT